MTLRFWIWVTVAFIVFDLIVYVYAVLNSQPLLRSDDSPAPKPALTPWKARQPYAGKTRILRILIAPFFLAIGVPFVIFYVIPGMGLGIIYLKAKTALKAKPR